MYYIWTDENGYDGRGQRLEVGKEVKSRFYKDDQSFGGVIFGDEADSLVFCPTKARRLFRVGYAGKINMLLLGEEIVVGGKKETKKTYGELRKAPRVLVAREVDATKALHALANHSSF